MKGVITIASKHERYYYWANQLFNSISLFVDIDFALVYDNEEYFNKYNLNNLVKYPIFISNIDNPYLLKYKLVEYTPFKNTIFFDADTVIFRDITPLFNLQNIAVYGEWKNDWLYKEFGGPLANPQRIASRFNLSKLYSCYSGYLRFSEENKSFLEEVINCDYYDKSIQRDYGRGIMPDELFLDITASKLKLSKFTPVRLNLSTNNFDLDEYFGFSYQGVENIKSPVLESVVKRAIKNSHHTKYLL